jgi:hypothetical protein
VAARGAGAAADLAIIGFLHSQSLLAVFKAVAAFHRGLAETSYIQAKWPST